MFNEPKFNFSLSLQSVKNNTMSRASENRITKVLNYTSVSFYMKTLLDKLVCQSGRQSKDLGQQ